MESKFNNSTAALNDFGNNLRDDVLKFQLEHNVAANLSIDQSATSITLTLVNQAGQAIGVPQTFSLVSSQGAIIEAYLDENAKAIVIVFDQGEPVYCDISAIYELLNNLVNNKQDKLTVGYALSLDKETNKLSVNKNLVDYKQGAGIVIDTLHRVISINPELLASIENKQDILVSGENIKTINNESILGAGNIVVEGRPGES